MKKLGKFKLFGLLIFLSVALVFVGGNFLEGKRPPPGEWWVTIPTYESGYNLYGIGIKGDGYYEDDSKNVLAGGGSGLRKHPDYPYHVFELTLVNTNSWGDSCNGEGEYYMPGDYTIGFRGITLNSEPLIYPDPDIDEGLTCLFPPFTGADSCSALIAPICMECFLNKWEHPSSWECVSGENRCYMGAYFKIKVFDDIWNYRIGGPATSAPISLYISVYTGIVAPEGEDFYHDIEIHKPEGATYMADVTRVDEDSWKIVFDLALQEEPWVEFRETHKVGEAKPKGKSGKYHYDDEERTTMIATADQFSFEITWGKIGK